MVTGTNRFEAASHRRRAAGVILRGWLVMLSMATAIAVLVALLWAQGRPASHSTAGDQLLVYCAAGIKPPVVAAAQEYEKAYRVTVQLQYGGSGTLLSNMQVAKSGDLFIAADASYIRIAREKGIVAETIPLATMRPVIAVRKGNPKNIRTLADLERADVRVAMANPDAASIGKVVQKLLEKHGQWAGLQRRVKVFKPTVNDVANDVKIGSVDAGIVWDATARQYPELELVTVPLLDTATETVTIGVLKYSSRPTSALRFARFLAARDRGQKHFEKSGYTPINGDAWAESPELIFYSGAVNRPAVTATLDAFEAREGVRIARSYNGCGILVGSIKAGGRPDAYLTCDASFADPVADLLDGAPREVSRTRMIILVQKNNPRGIRSLADLAMPGLKVGVGNPEQSTLGALTQRLLKNAGLFDKVRPNIQTETPTADMLVNQLRTGSLDAVVVYEASARAARGDCTEVPIPQAEALAVQTFSVGKESKYKHLAERLLDALRSQESRERYEAAGFTWPAKPAGGPAE
jgi:molybdenum ABC transporter molybdate-binding protein